MLIWPVALQATSFVQDCLDTTSDPMYSAMDGLVAGSGGPIGEEDLCSADVWITGVFGVGVALGRGAVGAGGATAGLGVVTGVEIVVEGVIAVAVGFKVVGKDERSNGAAKGFKRKPAGFKGFPRSSYLPVC